MASPYRTPFRPGGRRATPMRSTVTRTTVRTPFGTTTARRRLAFPTGYRGYQGRSRSGSVFLMRPETKYFDVGINTIVTWAGTDWASSEVPADNYINASGSAAAYLDSALIPSAVGSGYGEVNGNRYKLKKLRVRGSISVGTIVDQADAGNARMSRLLLVMDTQPNGAQAQGEDILQDYGAAGENLYSWKRVASQSSRFRILKDTFFDHQPSVGTLDGAAAADPKTNSTSFEVKQFSYQYTPRVPIEVNIKSGNATPTIAGLVTCNIFLLVAGLQSSVNTAVAVTVSAASRAYYCD